MSGEEIQFISVDELVLDRENPRLPESIDRSEAKIIEYIARNTALDDLMDAIATNGFFPGEPVVGIREEDKIVVVEGNRRLTAVKLLNNLGLLSKPSQRFREIVEGASHVPHEIPVVIRDSRIEVMPYLGFRHITGVKEWDPLSKARYLEKLFKATSSDGDTKERYKDIAKVIGSRFDHIQRNLDALAVYRRIEDDGFFDIDGLDESSFKFGVLSTAVADNRIGEFIGVCHKNDEGDFDDDHPIVNPGVLDAENIKYFSKWAFQKDPDSGKTVLGESRNLRKLSEIVANPRALETLKHGSSLDYAYQHTKGLRDDFRQLLYEAEQRLAQASTLVASMKWDEECFEVTKKLNDQLRLIAKALKDQRDGHDDLFD